MSLRPLLTLLIVTVLPAVASARSRVPPARADYGIEVATRGTDLALTFHNRTQRTIEVPVHVDAGERHYDRLTVTLVKEGEVTTVKLSADRDRSATVLVAIGPGGSHTETIDLARWSGPLAWGEYELIARWRTDRRALVATTVLHVIPERCGLMATLEADAAQRPEAERRDLAGLDEASRRSQLPELLLGSLLLLALTLLGRWSGKRAGGASVGVPHSLP